jgi:hypothetical protein
MSNWRPYGALSPGFETLCREDLSGRPLVASLSSAAKLIEGHVNAAATNGVRYGARLALTTTLSHFPKLETKLELLESECNADLTKGQLDAI